MIKILTISGYMLIRRENLVSVAPRTSLKGTKYVACIDTGVSYEYWEVSFEEYERLVTLYGER